MLKFNPKFSIQLTITIILTLGLSISFQSLLAAWTAPTVAPPGGNPNPPIYNFGSSASAIIDSNLTINDNFYVGANSFFVNNTTGNVGVGTTNPDYKFTVNGFVSADYLRAKYGRILVADAPNNDANTGVFNNSLTIGKDSTTQAGWIQVLGLGSNVQALQLNPVGGNVGIGATNPSQKLDVAGKIRMRTQTAGTDTDDTVATKKYVDDSAASYSAGVHGGHCDFATHVATWPALSCSNYLGTWSIGSCAAGWTLARSDIWIGGGTGYYYICLKN